MYCLKIYRSSGAFCEWKQTALQIFSSGGAFSANKKLVDN